MGVVSQELHAFVFSDSSSVTWSLPSNLGWLTSKPLDLFVSVSPALRSWACTAVSGLYVLTGDPKGRLHVCAVGPLPTETPAPRLHDC